MPVFSRTHTSPNPSPAPPPPILPDVQFDVPTPWWSTRPSCKTPRKRPALQASTPPFAYGHPNCHRVPVAHFSCPAHTPVHNPPPPCPPLTHSLTYHTLVVDKTLLQNTVKDILYKQACEELKKSGDFTRAGSKPGSGGAGGSGGNTLQRMMTSLRETLTWSSNGSGSTSMQTRRSKYAVFSYNYYDLQI